MRKKTNTSWQILETVSIILVCFSFFQYSGFPMTVYKLSGFLSVPILFLLSFRTLFSHSKDIFSPMIKALLLSYFFSMFMALILWGQGLMASYRASSVFFMILFYYYLRKRKFSQSYLENIIWLFAIIYVILWLYSLSRFPDITFGVSEDDVLDDSRGVARINFTGSIFLPFACFLSLNKFFSTKKKYFLLTYVFFFVFIVLQVTRQTIVITALVSCIYVFFYSKKTACYLIAFAIAALAGSQFLKINDDSIIANMIELSKEQSETQSKGYENVRVTEYKYFFLEWNNNPLAVLFGNGMPHMTSSYGHIYDRVKSIQKFFLSDVGYASMYVVNGIIGLIIYLLLFYKGIKIKVCPNIYYAKLFVTFLVFANIAASWYFLPDCQIAMSIAFYLLSIQQRNNSLCIKTKYIK